MPLFFSTLASQLLEPVVAASTAASTSLTVGVIPVVLAGVSANIAWQGLNVIRGVGGQHILLDLFATNLRAFIVLLAALGIGAGYADLIQAAVELQTSLVGADQPTATVGTAPAVLDAQFDALVQSYKTLLAAGFDHIRISALGESDFTGLEIIGIGSIVAVALSIFMAFAFVEIVAVQAAILMVAGIGPLFVAAAAFRSTTGYFSSWLAGLLRYSIEVAFLLLLVGVGLTLTATINLHLAEDLNGGELSTQLDLGYLLLETLGTSVILIWLTLKVDSIAASVFGGASISGAAVALAALAGGAAARFLDRPDGRSASAAGHADRHATGKASDSPGNARGHPASGSADRPGIDTLGAHWARNLRDH